MITFFPLILTENFLWLAFFNVYRLKFVIFYD